MKKNRQKRIKWRVSARRKDRLNLAVVLMASLLALLLTGITAFAADKVIVKNPAGTLDVFKVNDSGTTYLSDGGPMPGFSASNTRAMIANTSSTSDRTYLSLIAGETTGISRINFGDPDSENVGFFSYSHSNNAMQVFAGNNEVMRFVNSKMGIGGEVSPDSTLSIKGNAAIGTTYSGSFAGPANGMIVQGNVGIGTSSPSQKLYVVGNIFATGSITPGSSRELKSNIRDLTSNEAADALETLNPTRFSYKADPEEEHIGFIAEDVPA
jgi:hypothetical protein